MKIDLFSWLRPLQVKAGFGVRCENLLTQTECFYK